MKGEPVKQLAGFPVVVFAVALGASRNTSIPQAFAVGIAFSFPRAVPA
jgi:hypothetical protein